MRVLYGITFILLIASIVFADEYHVDKSKENQVKFISDAPIEDFEGVTEKIDGYLYYENDDLTEKSAVYFEVDLNSLDTGIGLRNRHMRENYLETDKFPTTHFKGEIINAVETSKNKFDVIGRGELFIHGIKKMVEVRGTLGKSGQMYNVKVTFEVKLSDYEIEVPSIMFYKIDETMHLQLNFFISKFD